MSTLNPDDDGVRHINVWSRAQTQLGQDLSNFSHHRFKHPEIGYFASVEGFWYYIKTGLRHEHLRRSFGFSAKSAGCKLEVVQMDPERFHELVRQAITCKLEQNPELLEALIANTLPLRHYYVYGAGQQRVVVEKKEHQWQLEHLESIAAKWRARDFESDSGNTVPQPIG